MAKMAKKTHPSPCTLTFTENFCLSGTAAVLSKTAIAPVERVKLLLQNQQELIKTGHLARPYKGIFDCTVRVFKTEGVVAFWRSNMVNCIRYFPTQALNFAFKDKIQKRMKTSRQKESNSVKVGKNILAGGTAGALSTCFVYSLDFARTLLANDAKEAGAKRTNRKYKGLIDVYCQTVRKGGITSLYTGFVISVFAIFVYRGLYFGLYDSLKPYLANRTSQTKTDLGLLPIFLVGYGVTVTANIIAYPIDTVRRRMMMAAGYSIKYKGSVQCAIHILRNEGFRSLMNGAGVSVIRSLAGGSLLVGFESFTKYYSDWKQERQGHVK